MKTIALKALDGMNPLGFLAAVGLHRILTVHGTDEEQEPPRMAWFLEGGWRPVLQCADDVDPVEAVMAHLEAFRREPALNLEYEDTKKRWQQDLKPPPKVYRRVQLEAVKAVEPSPAAAADFWAAYAPGTAVDNNGNTKPTALHFTAGQQQFLGIVRELASSLTVEQVAEALFGPWRRSDPLPQLRWDAQGERNHALLGFDPSKEKPTSTAGAEWLAFQALPLFPTSVARPRSGRVRVATTGFDRRGGEEGLVWPLWTLPAMLPSVRALVQHRRLRGLSAHEREALGVRLVLRSAVRRSAQGYGAFAPPEVLAPGG